MKKLLAIFLAGLMLLSFAACGSNEDKPSGNEDNPGTSQSDNQGGESTNNGGEESGTKTFSWPTADYIKDYMTWSGSGKIVLVTETNYTDQQNAGQTYPVVSVSIDAATLDELAAYVDVLKQNGFVFKDYEGLGEDLVYRSSGSCNWCGVLDGESYVNVTLYESAREARELIDGEVVVCKYQLKITMSSKTDGTWYL